MSGPWDKYLEQIRQDPQKTFVRYRINSGPWQLARGQDFLDDFVGVAFAGTIELDCVYLLP